MVSGKIIKNRIKSIKNTKKVTKSMELISAVKLQKASERSQSINSFTSKIEHLFDQIKIPENYSNILLQSSESSKEVVIVFGSERGLCGSFNSNVKKKIAEYMSQKKYSEVEFIVYGRNIAKFLKNRGFNITELYKVPTESFNMSYVKAAIDTQLNRFKQGETANVTLIYTEFINIVKQEVIVKPLLPITSTLDASTEEIDHDIEDLMEPSNERVLDFLIEERIKLSWYSALVHSLASEHVSRMIAMKNATEASGELISQLTLEYNKSRQASITQEITEIVSGMESITQTIQTENLKLNKFKILFNN